MNKSVSEIFKLGDFKTPPGDSSYIPSNVKQQIELWEKELTCIQERPAIMVLIHSSQTAKRFIDYCRQKNITVLKDYTAESAQRKKFVIDIKHEKLAMEF